LQLSQPASSMRVGKSKTVDRTGTSLDDDGADNG
jgi:hypothetical protein